MQDHETATPAAAADRALGELSEVLRLGLMALAEAGHPEDACRLAAQACRVLRQEQPRHWQVFNKLLHRLSPRSAPVGSAANPPAPTR